MARGRQQAAALAHPPVRLEAAPAPPQWPAAAVEMWPIEKLSPYANNPNTHPPEQVELIIKSIKKFGWTIPVLADEEGQIIAGHGRIMAAMKIGLREVPVMTAHGWSAEDKRLYVIADNQLPRRSEWDIDLLKKELGDLASLGVDCSYTGFGEIEMVSFLSGGPNFEPGTEHQQGKLDQLSPLPVKCPHCGGEFNGREHVQK